MGKRIICILLLVLLLIPAVYAKSETIGAELVTALGILERYDDGSFGQDDSITRGELANSVAKFLKLQESNFIKDYYKDVTSDLDCYYSVNALTGIGIFSIGNGTFRPTDRATGNEAIKVFVSALGYDVVANDMGGFPNGYINTANRIELINGLKNFNSSDFITKGDLATICYNALNTKPLMSYNANGEIIADSEDEIYLESRFNIKKIVGIVEKTRVTGLYEEDKLAKDEILIKGIRLSAKNSENLLGQNITAYFIDDDGEYTLVYADNSKNDSIVLTDKDKPRFSDGKIYYTKNDKEYSYKLSKGAIPIYNGTVKIDCSFIMPLDGSVELIDNNRDGNYDVVKTLNYISGIVESTDEDYIYLKENGSIELLDDKILKYDVTAKKGDVISALVSDNYIEINISDKKVTGVITEEFTEDGKVFLTVDNQNYQIAENCRGNYSIGKEAKLLLNIFDKIVYFEETKTDVKFGYIVDYARKKDISNSINLLVYDGGKKPITLSCADNVMIDGVKYSNNKIKFDGETTTSGDVRLNKHQLIILKTDGNKITFIDTKDSVGSGSDDRLEVTCDGSYLYKISSGNFEGKAFVTNNTKIFGVPKNKDETDAYSLYLPNALRNDVIYRVTAYRIDENEFLSSAVVVEVADGDGGISDETGLSIVKSTSNVADEDGLICTKIAMLFDGNEVSYLTSERILKYNTTESFNLNNISAGDVIRFGLNSLGKINQIDKIYDLQAGMARGNPIGSFTTCFGVSAGTVQKKSGEFILVARTNDTTDLRLYYATKYRIYVVEKNGGKAGVKIGKIDNIRDYQLVGDRASVAVIHSRFGDPKTIVVYND